MELYKSWAEAFTIFARYETPENSGVAYGPDSEVLYAGPPPSDVSPVDMARLTDLGWYADEGNECFYKFL